MSRSPVVIRRRRRAKRRRAENWRRFVCFAASYDLGAFVYDGPPLPEARR